MAASIFFSSTSSISFPPNWICRLSMAPAQHCRSDINPVVKCFHIDTHLKQLDTQQHTHIGKWLCRHRNPDVRVDHHMEWRECISLLPFRYVLRKIESAKAPTAEQSFSTEWKMNIASPAWSVSFAFRRSKEGRPRVWIIWSSFRRRRWRHRCEAHSL